MKRNQFIRTCGYAAISLPLAGMVNSCAGIYYATANESNGEITVKRSEFTINPDKPEKKRDFVLVETNRYDFPICLYKIQDGEYAASLMKCTHRGCELNVGGGIYSCPCHGSEFSRDGNVIQGPADQKLKTFTVKTDAQHVIISLS